MKTVLMITYEFPPSGGSGVQRSLYFARHLGEFGWRPIVIQADRVLGEQQDPGLLRLLPPGVHRHVIPACELGIIEEKWRAWLHGREGFAGRLREGIGWRLGRAANSLGSLLVPDEKLFWGIRALRVARRICRRSVNLLYSSAPRFVTHWVAWRLKSRFGLPWVADFRNMWTQDWAYSPASVVRRLSDRRYEQAFLNSADAVVSLSEGNTCCLASQTRADRRNRFVTIENGYDPDLFRNATPEHRDPGVFVLRYVGVLTAHQVTGEVFNAIRRAAQALRAQGRQLRFELYGRFGQDVRAHLETLGAAFHYGGYVPHDQVPGILQGADALLLAVNQGAHCNGVIPGKAYEYVGSGRPILCLTPAEGEVSRMMGKFGAGLVADSTNEEAIYEALLNLVRGERGGSAPAGERSALLRQLQRRELTRRLAELMDRVLSGEVPFTRTRRS